MVAGVPDEHSAAVSHWWIQSISTCSEPKHLTSAVSVGHLAGQTGSVEFTACRTEPVSIIQSSDCLYTMHGINILVKCMCIIVAVTGISVKSALWTKSKKLAFLRIPGAGWSSQSGWYVVSCKLGHGQNCIRFEGVRPHGPPSKSAPQYLVCSMIGPDRDKCAFRSLWSILAQYTETIYYILTQPLYKVKKKVIAGIYYSSEVTDQTRRILAVCIPPRPPDCWVPHCTCWSIPHPYTFQQLLPRGRRRRRRRGLASRHHAHTHLQFITNIITTVTVI